MIVRTRRNFWKTTKERQEVTTATSSGVTLVSLTTGTVATNITTLAPPVRGYHGGLFLPTGVIVVLVLASLCAILGVVYAYVYFTRISNSGPSSKKLKHALKTPRIGSESLRVPHVYDDEKFGSKDNQQQNSTHVFLFKFRR